MGDGGSTRSIAMVAMELRSIFGLTLDKRFSILGSNCADVVVGIYCYGGRGDVEKTTLKRDT